MAEEETPRPRVLIPRKYVQSGNNYSTNSYVVDHSNNIYIPPHIYPKNKREYLSSLNSLDNFAFGDSSLYEKDPEQKKPISVGDIGLLFYTYNKKEYSVPVEVETYDSAKKKILFYRIDGKPFTIVGTTYFYHIKVSLINRGAEWAFYKKKTAGGTRNKSKHRRKQKMKETRKFRPL